MGYLHQNVCYPALEQAQLAACSGASLTWGDGSSVFVASCTDSTGQDMSLRVCQDGGKNKNCTVVSQPWPIFHDCDFDGGTYLATAWFGAAFLLAVTILGFKHLLGLFDGRYEK